MYHKNRVKFMSALNFWPNTHMADPDIPAEVTASTSEDATSLFRVTHEANHSISASARPTRRNREMEQIQNERDASKKLKLAAESVAAHEERNVALKS